MKALITTIVLLAILGLLVATNPSPKDHSAYVRQELAKEAQNDGGLSEALMLLLGGVAESVVSNATTRDNYLIFSIYTTNLGGDELVVLGVLGRFLGIGSSNAEEVSFNGPPPMGNNGVLDEDNVLAEREEAARLRRTSLERMMQQIRETGLPLATENLNKSFASLQSSVADMRKVGAQIISESEKVTSCDDVYGVLQELFYDSLHHGIYHGPFSDSVREYGNASQEVQERVENGQYPIEQLPIEYQAWRDSAVEAGLNADGPSIQDIENLISDYKGKIEAATNAREASIEQARQLRTEGEDIYIRAGNSYERAVQRCR